MGHDKLLNDDVLAAVTALLREMYRSPDPNILYGPRGSFWAIDRREACQSAGAVMLCSIPCM